MADRVTGEEDDRWRSTQEATRQLTAARGAVPPPDVVAPQRSEQPDRDGPGGTRVEPVGNRGRDSAVSGDRRATAAERSGVRTEAVPEPADVAAPPSPSAARAPTPAATSPVSEVFEAVPAAPESDPPGATSAVAASPPRDAIVPAAPERAREVPASPAPIPSAPDADPPVVTPEVPASPPSSPQIAAMQVLVRAPDALLRVGGGPYMVPVSVGGASRLSTISITLLFDPDILLARTVLEGTFMRQGGAMVTFEQQVDTEPGRIDLTSTRLNDSTGATGSGLLAVVVFDAVGAGSATLTASGTTTTPGTAPIALGFTAVTVRVE